VTKILERIASHETIRFGCSIRKVIITKRKVIMLQLYGI